MQATVKLILLLFLMPVGLYAQDNDINLWLNAAVVKNLEKVDLSAEAELRSEGIFGHTDRLSLQAEAAFKLSKYVKLGASYQIMNYYDEKYTDYQLRNRFGIFAQGKYKTGPISFTLREQLQLTTKDETDRIKSNGQTDTYTVNPDMVWRNKLKMKYNIRGYRVTPALAVETFYQLNNPYGNGIEKIRYTASCEYKLSKQHHIEVYGMLNHKTTTSTLRNIYVIGIGYLFDI